jgi:methylisocitrate lyase
LGLSDRRSKFRKRLKEEISVFPGAFNALSAMAIERAGFDGVYLSGAALSNTVFGMPDVGMTTLTEAVRHAKQISQAVDLPTISDADTGFGESVNVARCVREFEAAGATGIHIEDQVLPKKCGHLDGKELISVKAMSQKLRSAVEARSDRNFLLIARTDARAVEGFDAAVERAKRYIDAGADAIFPEAMQNEDEFAAFAERVPVPLLANMTEYGKSPLLTVDQLDRMGYKMVIFPMTLVRATMLTIEQLLIDLKNNGSQTQWLDRMQTRQELYDLLDYDGLAAKDRIAAGDPI